MVIHFRVDFEIADNRANNLVVGAVSRIENLKFPIEDGKQLLNIAMLLGQALNDHGSAPHSEPQEIIPNPASGFAADQIWVGIRCGGFNFRTCRYETAAKRSGRRLRSSITTRLTTLRRRWSNPNLYLLASCPNCSIV